MFGLKKNKDSEDSRMIDEDELEGDTIPVGERALLVVTDDDVPDGVRSI